MKNNLALLLVMLLALTGCGNKNSGYEVYGSQNEEYCSMCMGTGQFRNPSTPFVSRCVSCNGTGVSNDSRMNSTKPRYRCVYCNGTGQDQITGAGCTFCYGYGITYISPEQQASNGGYGGGNSSSNNNPLEICPTCKGGTLCPVCKRTGGTRYGQPVHCTLCNDTRKCPTCKGSGFVPK